MRNDAGSRRDWRPGPRSGTGWRGWRLPTWLVGCAVAWVLLCPARADASPKTPIIELITIGPGDELFSRWGHTGLRVRADGNDRIYSYGYAVDGGIGQLVALVQGRAIFRLAARRWTKALPWYERRDRHMEAQALQLPPAQLRALVERLKIESRPINRDFVYDSLRNNCSTRLRDLLDEVSGSALARAAEDYQAGRTLRTDTRTATASSLPVAIGLDVLVGSEQDAVPTGWEAMYRPADLQAIATATILDSGTPFLGPVEVLIASKRPPVVEPSPKATTWLLLFAIVLAVAIAWGRFGSNTIAARRAGALALAAAGAISGLLGLLVVATMIVATVPSLAYNENFLLFVPLDAAAVVAATRWWRGRESSERIQRIGRWYVRIRLAALAVLLLTKLAGIAAQDNLALIGAAVVVLVPLAVGPRSPARQAAAAAAG